MTDSKILLLSTIVIICVDIIVNIVKVIQDKRVKGNELQRFHDHNHKHILNWLDGKIKQQK